MYKASDIAVFSPVALPVLIGEKLINVGVGGSIKVKPLPPHKSGYVIREATKKELKSLYDRGYTKYIDFTPRKTKVKDEE